MSTTTVATPVTPIPRMSFAELMDEEYARKLQQEEEKLHAKEQQDLQRALEESKNDVDGEYEEPYEEDFDEYEYYEEFDENGPLDEPADVGREEENSSNINTKEMEVGRETGRDGELPDNSSSNNNASSEATTLENVNDEELARLLAEEEDYIAAMNLQRQMDEEHAFQYQQKVTHPSGRQSHVRSCTVDELYGGQTLIRTDGADADDELDADSVPHPIKSAVPPSRKGKKVVTKHDIEATSKYNAQNISKFVDSNLDKNARLPSSVYNQLKVHSRSVDNSRIRYKSKEDHASYEQALDPRTRIILYKMLNSGILAELNGIVSTGKEANVYHAVGNNMVVAEEDEETQNLPFHELNKRKSLVGGEYAIKIFKTTLNEFKNRTEYVDGDYRFRNEHFSHQNPRKVIKLWAKKEMRNLKRMRTAGIPCPLPVLLREHVLIMTFVGNGGRPALHLKDASLTPQQLLTVYHELLKIVRDLYHKAGLIHADLSEFNILVHEGRPYIIDVSQAVQNDHPNSMDFLRRDCVNVYKFFKSKGISGGLSPRQLFDFITDIHLTDAKVDEFIATTEENNKLNPPQTVDEQIESEVFLRSFIPRTLSHVQNPMKEVESRKNKKSNSDLYYGSVTGLSSVGEDAEILEEDPDTTTDDEE